MKTIGIAGQATDVVEAYDGVWVVTGIDNGIVHLNPRTGGELSRTELTSDRLGGAHAVAAGAGAIWVATGGWVVKVDPNTGRRTRVCCESAGVNDVAVGHGAVWHVDVHQVIVRVSPKTLRPTASTELGVIPVAVTVAYGGVWLAVPDPIRARVSLWGIDPQTVRVVQTIDVGPGLSYLPSLELTSGAGSLWVTNYDAGTVVRVDPASGKVMSTIRVGGHPFGIAFGDNRIWVTVS